MEQDFAFKDYYKILDIPVDAGIDEIRSAFRKLARKTHPDATKDPLNYENFILIREGYDVLSDKSKRQQYDAFRKAYYSQGKKSPGSNAQSLSEDFDISSNHAYREEWEYFKLHPDEYLNLFQSSLKMFLGTMLAVFTGVATPIIVFLVILAGILITAVLLSIIAGALITTSFSSVAGIIFAIMIFRILKKKTTRWRKKGVTFLGKIAVHPLRGIPKQYGKHVLYMNYTAIFILLIVFGYYIVMFLFERFSPRIVIIAQSYADILLLLIIAVCSVAVIAVSLVVIYEIIMESLLQYPSVRYMRVRIRKGTGIEYHVPKLLNDDTSTR